MMEFRVANGTKIYRNPTDDEYRQLRRDACREQPWLYGMDEPLLRRTFDEQGNVYYWDAPSAVHTQIEPHINRIFQTRSSQHWQWWRRPDKDDYPINYFEKGEMSNEVFRN